MRHYPFVLRTIISVSDLFVADQSALPEVPQPPAMLSVHAAFFVEMAYMQQPNENSQCLMYND